MISNWFYYCLTLLATVFIMSSCLNSDDNIEYDYSSDAQVTSLRLSSVEDTLNVLPDVKFSINQVASAPVIFNKDSLPYLFDVSKVDMEVTTNGASAVKLYLNNPDSSFIWNMSDSVSIKRLKQLEVFAQDGQTKKTYSFILNTHQQDPDTIFWQNVANNYIDTPTEQVTISSNKHFHTYYKTNNSIRLATSLIDDGETWTDESLSGLPQNVRLKSIQTNVVDNNKTWIALDTNNKVYLSGDGKDWNAQSTDLPVKSVLGTLPSYTKDSVLAVVKDGDQYKFAKTIDFSSMNVLNEIPTEFPVDDFSHITVKDSLVYTAKYLVATGGNDINGVENNSVWLLQETENDITYTSKFLDFNVTGSSLFNYDDKVYLLTSDDDKNQLYTSKNYGVFWEKAGSKQDLPDDFKIRSNQSVSVDNKNNIWIFGGKTSNQTQLVEVWKGRINKLFVK